MRGLAKNRSFHIFQCCNLKEVPPKKILEIGPGYGFLGQALLAQWPRIQYYGLETDISCHSGLKVKGIKLHLPSSPLPQVDLIIMSHVLEHIPNPEDFLKNLARKLKKNGCIFIEVPCNDFLHKPIDEPHLLFFDKQPLKILLGKLGFRNIALSYHGQLLQNLKRLKRIRRIWCILRNRFLAMGLTAPFGGYEPGLEHLSSKERAAVKPYKAHLESAEPAWWLRAVAIKP